MGNALQWHDVDDIDLPYVNFSTSGWLKSVWSLCLRYSNWPFNETFFKNTNNNLVIRYSGGTSGHGFHSWIYKCID